MLMPMRVAVGFGLGDRVGAGVAARARLVLDDEGLAELLLQAVGDQRPTMSGVEPAPNGMKIFTGFTGHSCASADCANRTAASTASKRLLFTTASN